MWRTQHAVAEDRDVSLEMQDVRTMGGDKVANGSAVFGSVHRHKESLIPTTHNPFENFTPWNSYEVFKVIILAPTLLPFRLFVLLICTVLTVIIASIVTCGITLHEDRGCYHCLEPLRGWRSALLKPIRLLNRGLLWSFGFWRIVVIDRRTNRTHTPNLLVVAPHITPIDQFVVASVFPPLPCGVGDVGIIRKPLMRCLGLASQSIFVDVERKTSRDSCRDAIAGRADPQKWNGPATMIFPEGRVTNGRALIQFKLGAFSPGQPVLPVVLRYPFQFFDPAWVGRNRTAFWGLRMMLQFTNYCIVEVLDTYYPSEEEKDDSVYFANTVRELMAGELKLMTTEHTYDDAFLYQAAIRANVDNDFEVQAIKALCEVDLGQLKEWLRSFHKVDQDGDGLLSPSEFCEAIQVTAGEKRLAGSTDRLFRFFDTDGSGTISYREFVQAVALLSGKCSPASRAKLAFLVYDVDGCRKVKRSVLREAINNGFATGVGRIPKQKKSMAPQRHSLPTQSTTKVAQSACASPARARPSCQEQPRARTCAPAYWQSATVGDRLLEEKDDPLDSDEDAEIDYNEFCRIVDSNPEVVEAAFDNIRLRLKISDPVEPAGSTRSI